LEEKGKYLDIVVIDKYKNIHNMKYVFLFAEILPLILFYLFLANTDSMILFSTTYLGKLVAVMIIMFYSYIHWIYGLFICILVILFYQTDFIEGMQSYHFNVSPMIHEDGKLYNTENFEEYNKEKPQYSFMSDFITTDNSSIHMSGENLIDNKLRNQEEITYPKTSDDWVSDIWKSWFIDSYSAPYPVDSICTANFTNI